MHKDKLMFSMDEQFFCQLDFLFLYAVAASYFNIKDFLIKSLILGAKTNPVLLIRVPQKNAKFEILKYGCGPWRLA